MMAAPAIRPGNGLALPYINRDSSFTDVTRKVQLG